MHLWYPLRIAWFAHAGGADAFRIDDVWGPCWSGLLAGWGFDLAFFLYLWPWTASCAAVEADDAATTEEGNQKKRKAEDALQKEGSFCVRERSHVPTCDFDLVLNSLGRALSLQAPQAHDFRTA